jgi:microsomal dipeptidase-like Zn-dependent dipeptidase
MENNFIDLHIHPAMKPLGKSFDRTPGVNSTRRNDPSSIWYYDPPTFKDKLINIAITLTKFRQSDFTSLAYGGAHVVFVALSGLEKGFVMNKLGTRLIGDLLNNLVIGIGRKRIDHIQSMKDYFTDLKLEYDFYKQLDGHKYKIDGEWFSYRIVNCFEEIDLPSEEGVNTIYVILTVEGTQVFNSGLMSMGITADETEVLDNLRQMKQWDKRIFFVGMAHHFYNEQCGHAPSLHGIARKICDQTDGVNTGFTDLGLKVLHELLDNTNNKRILIDLKHLSIKARQQYYSILENAYAGENIPLIVSHGAVTGLKSHGNQVIDIQGSSGKFQEEEINFYDDEILKIDESRGIFGLQLDERRIASKTLLKQSSFKTSRRKMLYVKSQLVWNQVQHIAEVLDKAGRFAWGIQAIGSDYDGMIDPLNGFWTAEDMPLLDSYLEKHAFNYLNSAESAHLNSFNRIKTSEIIQRFMHDNAFEFLSRNF